MTDTVFILGAGFSRDAGIPLLGGFVERMWELAMRGRTDKPLAHDDLQALKAAMQIRGELDTYHGRAHFDDRNIEDLLSILSFNLLGGTKRDRQKLVAMTNAIARTIEICCSVKHPGIEPKKGRVIKDGPDLYRSFWKALFAAASKGHSIPSIITFNYDLILERSLLQVLIGTEYGNGKRVPFEKIGLDYHFDLAPPRHFKINYVHYETWDGRELRSEIGTVLEEIEPSLADNRAVVDLLKLHGSLNFPRPRNRPASSTRDWNLAVALSDPFILPPVFNKLSGDAASSMWSAALARLRSAKNVVVVGYSLPQTDIYMQYFLKAALGPNLDLNRLTVFDPILFTSRGGATEMQHRYESCFSPQLRSRINFTPSVNSQSLMQGSAAAFVRMLETAPEQLLF